MTRYHAEVTIDASPSRVWAVLVDFPSYPEWNPFTVTVRSLLEVGTAVDMEVRLNGRIRRQRETLRAIEPQRLLRWGMQLGPRWLLHAEREQRLEPWGDGGTRYTTDDSIEGLLEPLVRLLFAATLDAGFTSMTQALKARVESEADV